MSVWTDIQKRSAGEDLSKEDFVSIYNGGMREIEEEILYKGEYKSEKYEILTNSLYPFIRIYMTNGISFFSGAGLVRIKNDDNVYFNLRRTLMNGKTIFEYFCNEPDDFVYGEHDGKKYTVELLKQLAEWFIDEIHRCERENQDYYSRHDS